MKPLPRKSWDMVALQNIDDEDFVFSYDASQGNPAYVIPAGDVKRFPRFLANHALKHLIDKIITKANKSGAGTSNLEVRRDLMSQIVVGEETMETVSPKSDSEQVQDAIELANKPSELDRILDKKREQESKADETAADLPTPSEKEEEKFDQLNEEKKVEVVKPKKVANPLPTRKELFKFATDKMGMVFDEKTTKKFTKMPIKQVIKEFSYPKV